MRKTQAVDSFRIGYPEGQELWGDFCWYLFNQGQITQSTANRWTREGIGVGDDE